MPIEAQRARIRAAKQWRNSLGLRAARLILRPFCACSSKAHKPPDAAPNKRETRRTWPREASLLCASSLEDKVVKYSVYVAHNDFVDFQRMIDLRLESGGTASIYFPKDPPSNWLQFNGSCTTLYMAQDEFADVYHLLQTESPVFFTALNLFGIRVGAVHMQLDPTECKASGQGDEQVPQSLAELIRRAKRQEAGMQPAGSPASTTMSNA
jgi:hypothetical protein